MWCLVLTNARYPVPLDYQEDVNLKEIPESSLQVDERIWNPLVEMLDEMKDQGLKPVIRSGYRTLDKQELLFSRRQKEYLEKGDSMEEAREQTERELAVPGSGEHCLGLAVDINSESHPQLEEAFGDTPEGLWLREHSWEYGFILRYDRGKEEITGINYEPWHFRYVGEKAAEYLNRTGMCLEEFYIEESLYG